MSVHMQLLASGVGSCCCVLGGLGQLFDPILTRNISISVIMAGTIHLLTVSFIKEEASVYHFKTKECQLPIPGQDPGSTADRPDG